ncbi:MAG TPA: glutathione peroxidase [Candidatus Hydrogenedentes bacterium]|nr:glutathione peroxidase [Candidatus Hydrogenedentota bacterium]HRK36232.1 glutathione peroxidase [Candidatus Hydrogenedentota bacterium]
MRLLRKIVGKVLRIGGGLIPPKRGEGASVLSHAPKSIDGATVELGDNYAGKVLMIVNVASKCGLTPQYEQLESLNAKYKDKGFAILAFPCNDFGAQEPGSASEIKEFCRINYKTSFDLFEKIHVTGDASAPLYKTLTSDENGPLAGPIKWNFTKFIVGRDGRVKARVEPPTTPTARSVIDIIEAELSKPA